jgi:hypothetical protein
MVFLKEILFVCLYYRKMDEIDRVNKIKNKHDNILDGRIKTRKHIHS